MDKETKEFIVMFTATFLGTAIGMHLWMRYTNQPMLSQSMKNNQTTYTPYTCMELLNKSIDMHQMHIDNPETATPVSQYEMMGLMLTSRDCLNSQLNIK